MLPVQICVGGRLAVRNNNSVPVRRRSCTTSTRIYCSSYAYEYVPGIYVRTAAVRLLYTVQQYGSTYQDQVQISPEILRVVCY